MARPAPKRLGRAVMLAMMFAVSTSDASAAQEQRGNESEPRRSLQASCDAAQLQLRMQDVEAECCNEDVEECYTGFPTRCNPGCAAVFLPVRRFSARAPRARMLCGAGSARWLCPGSPFLCLCPSMPGTHG